MKNTLKLFGILIVTLFILTGCAYTGTVQVNKDGSADVEYTKALTAEEFKQIEDSGYSKEYVVQPAGVDKNTGIETTLYNEDGLEGNTLRWHVDNIERFSLTELYGGMVTTPYDEDEEYINESGNEAAKIPPAFVISESFFTKKVVLNANIDLSAADYSAYNIEQNYKFKLNSKGSIHKTNATTKRGGTAEWDLNFEKYDAITQTGGNTLEATIVFYKPLNISLVVFGILVVGVLAYVAHRIILKKGKKD